MPTRGRKLRVMRVRNLPGGRQLIVKTFRKPSGGRKAMGVIVLVRGRRGGIRRLVWRRVRLTMRALRR